MLRAAWGVPLGLGPTTDAQLRAAKVLWIVGVARIPTAGVPQMHAPELQPPSPVFFS